MRDWPPRLIATAKISSDGTQLRSVGIENVTNPATGDYRIFLKNNYETDTLHVSVTPEVNTIPAWGEIGPFPTNEIGIVFSNPAGDAADTPFTVRVYQDA